MNTFECEVYIFGAGHAIFINTDHTLEELEKDWGLRERLIIDQIISQINVQSYIEQV